MHGPEHAGVGPVPIGCNKEGSLTGKLFFLRAGPFWCVQRQVLGIHELLGPQPSLLLSLVPFVWVLQGMREALPGGRPQKPFQMNCGPIGCSHCRDHSSRNSFFFPKNFKHGKLFFKQIECINRLKYKKGKTCCSDLGRREEQSLYPLGPTGAGISKKPLGLHGTQFETHRISSEDPLSTA